MDFLRDGFFIFCTALSVILDWEFDTYIVVTLEFISNSPGFLWYFLNHLKCGINIWDFARPFLQRLFLTVCNHWSLCFHNLYLGNILVEISFNATSYNRTNKPKKKKKAKETDSVTSPSLCKLPVFCSPTWKLDVYSSPFWACISAFWVFPYIWLVLNILIPQKASL